jgi:hypothetical protein
LIDHCLFLSTGAEQGRATVDGKLRASPTGRPVGVITNIEGVVKAELQARCVTVQYAKSGHSANSSEREEIEREISALRHEIGTAMMNVLARYPLIREERRPTPNPKPNFRGHFTALCDLLRAYGEVTRKPPEWAEDLIQQWNTTLLDGNEEDADDNELEQPIKRVLKDYMNPPLLTEPPAVEEYVFSYQGVPGMLYVTTASNLLTCLQKLRIPNLTLPKNARGLRCRLNSCRFQELQFLPTDAPEVGILKRSGAARPIGFWRRK